MSQNIAQRLKLPYSQENQVSSYHFGVPHDNETSVLPEGRSDFTRNGSLPGFSSAASSSSSQSGSDDIGKREINRSLRVMVPDRDGALEPTTLPLENGSPEGLSEVEDREVDPDTAIAEPRDPTNMWIGPYLPTMSAGTASVIKSSVLTRDRGHTDTCHSLGYVVIDINDFVHELQNLPRAGIHNLLPLSTNPRQSSPCAATITSRAPRSTSSRNRWIGIRPCYLLIGLGILVIAGSLAPALWRSADQGDLSGGFALGQYILGIGVLIIGSMVVIHTTGTRGCTCWLS